MRLQPAPWQFFSVGLLVSIATTGCNTSPQTSEATPAPQEATPQTQATAQSAPTTRPTPTPNIPQVDLSKPPVEAAVGKVVDGEQFKAIFPSFANGYTVTFEDTKPGYAGATVTKGTKKVAALSVSDLASAPKKAGAYLTGPQIMGYPSLSSGDRSAILVGNRYVVSVRSLTPAFSAKDRQEWLMKFKPSNLARTQ